MNFNKDFLCKALPNAIFQQGSSIISTTDDAPWKKLTSKGEFLVSIDSRTIQPGEFFVPLSGPNFDGHNFILDGGATTREEMIRSTKRGVLITRFWYTNMVEPKSLLLTGLTRDGNFLIENGRIVSPARNMRFNQRIGELFARLIAIGPTERTWRAAGDGAPAAPPIMVENFNFSSKSSGI